MLRIVLLLIVSLSMTSASYGQVRFGKVKCDSFQVMLDTNRAVVYRRNKTMVFDKVQKRFLMRPTKMPVFHLAESDLLIQVEEDQMVFIYLAEKRMSHTLYSDDPNHVHARFPVAVGAIYDSLMLFNKTCLNYKSGAIVQDISGLDDHFLAGPELEISRGEDDLLVFNYAKLPLPYAANEHTAVVFDKGFTKSGVYDLVNKRWAVPAIYEKCERFENNIFCLKRDSIIATMPVAYEPVIDITYSYDYYQIDGGELTLIEAGIKTNDQLNLARVFGVDSLSNCAYSEEFLTNQYVSYKNGNQGLIAFQLFDQIDNDEVGNANLVFERLLTEDFDYVLSDLERGQVITANRGSVFPISFYTFSESNGSFRLVEIGSANIKLVKGGHSSGVDAFFLDDKCYRLPFSVNDKIENDTTLMENLIMGESMFYGGQRVIGLELVEDSLLIVYNYKNDSIDLFAEPIKSIEYPDEDSIVLDLESGFLYALYPAPIPGYEYSGVFNLNSRDWFIVPENSRIYYQDATFLVAKPIRDEEYGEVIMDDHYMKTLDENIVFENVNYLSGNDNLCKAVKQILKRSSPQESYEFPPKSFIYEKSNSLAKEYEKYYYVLGPDGWSVQYPSLEGGYWLEASHLTKPKEFVHYDPFFDYVFWLEGDSIYLKMDSIYAVSKNNGEILLSIQSPFSGMNDRVNLEKNCRIELIEKTDTVSLFIGEYDLKMVPTSSTSILINNDDLIVDERQLYDEISPNLILIDEYFEPRNDNGSFRKFQTETSAIWQENQGKWLKITPFYASVERNQLGYLVSTGSSEEIQALSEQEARIVEARFILLDKSLKPVSFMDFFEFESAVIHDFGIQLCAGGGCFLVANDGQLITSNKWDQFELEDGRIKATRYQADFDPYLEFMNPDEMIESVKFFDISAD